MDSDALWYKKIKVRHVRVAPPTELTIICLARIGILVFNSKYVQEGGRALRGLHSLYMRFATGDTQHRGVAYDREGWPGHNLSAANIFSQQKITTYYILFFGSIPPCCRDITKPLCLSR